MNAVPHSFKYMAQGEISRRIYFPFALCTIYCLNIANKTVIYEEAGEVHLADKSINYEDHLSYHSPSCKIAHSLQTNETENEEKKMKTVQEVVGEVHLADKTTAMKNEKLKKTSQELRNCPS